MFIKQEKYPEANIIMFSTNYIKININDPENKQRSLTHNE